MNDETQQPAPEAAAEKKAEASAPAADKKGLPSGKDLDLQDLSPSSGGDTGNAGLEAIYDVPVVVKAVLGTKEMPIHELLKLGRGAVVDLDRKVGDAVDVYVNDRLVARGEVVIVDDRLGITMTEIVKSQG